MENGGGTEVAPAIGISYSAQVGDGRSLVFQTHVPQLWKKEEIDKVVDRLRACADRQVSFGKVEAMDHELDLKDRIIQQLRDGIAAVDAKVQHLMQNPPSGGKHPKPPAAEEQQRKNAVLSLDTEVKNRAEMASKRQALLDALNDWPLTPG